MIDSAQPSLCYRLSLPRPDSHVCDIELEFSPPDGVGESVDLTMAAWSPGSYLIRDYARFVRGVEASADGHALEVRKLDKHTWRVSTAHQRSITVRYQVYGRDLTVRTNHIDATHAFLHGPATYLMVAGERDSPCRVEIHPPEGRGWVIATGLEPDGDGFRAANADDLLDCPIHVGVCDERTMEVCSTQVRLVVWGRIASGGVADLDRLRADLARIMATHAARFGGRIPCDRYTFILMLSPGGYGGLEHKNSSANLHTPFCMQSGTSYRGLLELLSHEFFHVWNGKRMFPKALCRFDYSKEAYTRCLWVMEGLTSYYDRYTVLRAGRMQPRHFLSKLAEEWTRFRSIPGRLLHSLEDASFDAWIKLYKPHESNLNTTISYYLAGGLAATALDLEIRHRTGGDRSLDDVLTLLWREFGHAQTPYPEDLQATFERAVGIELGEFFERVVRGREDPDIPGALELVGLQLGESRDDDKDDGTGGSSGRRADTDQPDGRLPGSRVWLGIVLGHGLRIDSVLDHSPAHRAGVSPGDAIVAMDRWQVKSASDVSRRLRHMSPGDSLEVALFRRRELAFATVELALAPPRRMDITGLESPADACAALYVAWLGEEHPGAGKIASGSGVRWV